MILLGLGSNMGDRRRNLEQALVLLGRRADAPLVIRAVSPVYESAALLPEGAPADWNRPYYNIVIAAETHATPERLLEIVKTVEQRIGRMDVGRWGPRLIDIDILAYGAEKRHSETLTLPHGEMLARDFVLVPLADIWPRWPHPCGKTAAQLVAEKNMGPGLSRTGVELRW